MAQLDQNIIRTAWRHLEKGKIFTIVVRFWFVLAQKLRIDKNNRPSNWPVLIFGRKMKNIDRAESRSA